MPLFTSPSSARSHSYQLYRKSNFCFKANPAGRPRCIRCPGRREIRHNGPGCQQWPSATVSHPPAGAKMSRLCRSALPGGTTAA